MKYVVGEIKRLQSIGTDLRDICLVARTHNLLDGYISGLREEDIRLYEIRRSKIDDRNFEGIRVATMHRVKGLEFKYVFVVAANYGVIPLKSAINTLDSITENESLTAEKCLLYVALTRAQEVAYITSYGKQSDIVI